MKIPTPEGNLWEVRLSSLRYPCVSASVEVGLIKALKSPKSIPELAMEIQCSELAVEVLIRVLWADAFVEKKTNGFVLTQIAKQHFLEESPYYWGRYLGLQVKTQSIVE